MRGYLDENSLKKLQGFRNVIFIDRDGVINKRMPPHQHVLRLEDFEILPDVYDALKVCNKNGFPVIMISNQRCIALGSLTEGRLQAIHDGMIKRLEEHNTHLEGIFYCPHNDSDGCNCRKPKPGLFFQAENDLAKRGIYINKKKSWMIGDEITDIMAGKKYGINTAFVNSRDRKILMQGDEGLAALTAENFLGAMEQIIENERIAEG